MAAWAALWPIALHAENRTSVHDVPTRSGVTVRVLVIKPERPVATVLLFAGGPGRASISREGEMKTVGFPVRARELFVKQGFVTAVLSAPSDRMPEPAMSFFRDTAAHAEDVQHVIGLLRKETALPVWLIGHSAGSTSVANVAIRLQDSGPDGIVLSASLNGKPSRMSGSLDALSIEQIAVPTLVSHHEQDECEWTLFRNAKKLMGRLKKAPKTGLISFTGGGPASGDVCESAHYHSYQGLDEEVVSRMSEWIKSNLKSP